MPTSRKDKHMKYQWRPMAAADLPAVMAMAAVVHAGYFEEQRVFAERLALFAPGCWIAQCVDGALPAQAVGYAVMHPARLGQPPALNSLLQALDDRADCLYLHDVALLADARGAGLGRALLQILREQMRRAGLKQAALVAVHNSRPYWEAVGFAILPQAPAALLEKLASYDAQAAYMVMAPDDLIG